MKCGCLSDADSFVDICCVVLSVSVTDLLSIYVICFVMYEFVSEFLSEFALNL